MSAPPCFVDSFYLPLKHVAIVLQAYFSLEHKLQGEGDEIGEELLQPARPAGMGAVRGSQGPTAGAVAEQGGPGCRGTDSLLVSLEVQHQLVEGQVAVRGVSSHLLLLAYCTKEGEKLTAVPSLCVQGSGEHLQPRMPSDAHSPARRSLWLVANS